MSNVNKRPGEGRPGRGAAGEGNLNSDRRAGRRSRDASHIDGSDSDVTAMVPRTTEGACRTVGRGEAPEVRLGLLRSDWGRLRSDWGAEVRLGAPEVRMRAPEVRLGR